MHRENLKLKKNI